MRKLLFLGLSVFYMLMMTFCEYTPTVIDHITTEENYVQITVNALSAEYNEDGYSYLTATLTDYEYFEDFFGVAPDNTDPDRLSAHPVQFKIVTDNAEALKERGFFDSIKGGESLTVRVTHWIHNGINYFYVAEVVSESGTYLFFEEGIRGMTNAAISIKDFEYDKILRQK